MWHQPHNATENMSNPRRGEAASRTWLPAGFPCLPLNLIMPSPKREPAEALIGVQVACFGKRLSIDLD